MKREYKDIHLLKQLNWCCPGHDTYPCDTYRNNKSKRARSRDKKKEHRYVRRYKRQNMIKNINEEIE